MVDSDTPPVGFIHEGMDCRKEVIAKSSNNMEDEYMEVWKILDGRCWIYFLG